MEYSNEEELILERYEALRQKERQSWLKKVMMILLSGLFFCIVLLFFFLKSFYPSTKSETAELPECILELRQTEIEVEQGAKLNYLSYVQTATIDGESALSKVEYNEIDTNTAGTYAITYQLSTAEENKVMVLMKVEVLKTEEEAQTENETAEEKQRDEPDEEAIEEIKEETETKSEASAPTASSNTSEKAPTKSNASSSSSTTSKKQSDKSQTVSQTQTAASENSSSSSNASQSQTNISSSTTTTVQPFTQYFLFSNGYTMENVQSACEAAGKASGLSWSCTPVRDETTQVYLGMLLQTK